jgi:hypothetical protein
MAERCVNSFCAEIQDCYLVKTLEASQQVAPGLVDSLGWTQQKFDDTAKLRKEHAREDKCPETDVVDLLANGLVTQAKEIFNRKKLHPTAPKVLRVVPTQGV